VVTAAPAQTVVSVPILRPVDRRTAASVLTSAGTRVAR
jgi:hypothetical protein